MSNLKYLLFILWEKGSSFLKFDMWVFFKKLITNCLLNYTFLCGKFVLLSYLKTEIFWSFFTCFFSQNMFTLQSKHLGYSVWPGLSRVNPPYHYSSSYHHYTKTSPSKLEAKNIFMLSFTTDEFQSKSEFPPLLHWPPLGLLCWKCWIITKQKQ